MTLSCLCLIDWKSRKAYLLQFQPLPGSTKLNVMGHSLCDKGFKLLFGVSNDMVASLKNKEGKRAACTGKLMSLQWIKVP